MTYYTRIKKKMTFKKCSFQFLGQIFLIKIQMQGDTYESVIIIYRYIIL